MPERPVTPSDCALAVALPMSRAELLSDLGSSHPSDFARGLGRLYKHTSLDSLADDYEKQMEAGRRAIDLAAEFGVTIVKRATLSHLRDLTAQFHVVSVMAHAPSPGICPEDILDPGAILRAVATGTGDDHERLRRHLSSLGLSLDEPPPSPTALAEALEGALWTRDLLRERTPDQMDRTRMEDAFPSSLRPAPVIELASGLHDLSAVRAAISPRFEGILDLSTCTSVVLAEALKRARDDFLVVGTIRPTIPRHRFLLYQVRLEEMVTRDCPVLFTEVNRFVARAFELAVAR